MIPAISIAYRSAHESAVMRHIPSHPLSGCAAICAISRETSRYTTPNPRNVTLDAPSRSLMAHIPSHFAPKTRERTRRDDERTRRIDERTRPGCERTQVSQRNPSGQDDAGLTRERFSTNGLERRADAGIENCGQPALWRGSRLPKDPGSSLTEIAR